MGARECVSEILRSARMPGEGGVLHREDVDRHAAPAKFARHEILYRVLVAAGRGKAHQLLGEGDLVGEANGGGGSYALAEVGVDGHDVSHGFFPILTAGGSFRNCWNRRDGLTI